MAKVTFDITLLKFSEKVKCVLTGMDSSSITPVQLRHMWFLGPVWVGESMVVPIPLNTPVNYTVLQHLRTFRWVICLFLPLPVINMVEFTLDYQWVKTAIFFGMAIGGWLGIGSLLNKEKIRLVKIGKDRKTVTVAFNDGMAADRFKEQVVEGLVVG